MTDFLEQLTTNMREAKERQLAVQQALYKKQEEERRLRQELKEKEIADWIEKFVPVIRQRILEASADGKIRCSIQLDKEPPTYFITHLMREHFPMEILIDIDTTTTSLGWEDEHKEINYWIDVDWSNIK